MSSKYSLPFAAVAVSLVLSGCAVMQREPTRRVVATATLLDGSGNVVGNATLGALGARYDLGVEVRDLPAGPHGLHLHTTGRCQPRDFSSAGGHLNPFGRQHGSMNTSGSHLGDLPNIEVADDGSGAIDSLLNGDIREIEPQIFDADGTAIVVHSGPDDYRTDPSGASGSRIACGVFAQVR